MKRLLTAGLPTVIIFLLSACSTIQLRNAVGVPVASHVPPSEFPERGGANDDWGLALSGGGVRSAYFAIGALKALYDDGFLDSIDVISSVSGGGYASYWLFRRHLESSGQSRFGEAVFSNAAFDKSVCELEALGNFHSYPSMIRSLFTFQPFAAYHWAIRRSFGFADSVGQVEPAIEAIMPHVRAGTAPFFILNATIHPGIPGRLPNALELSPEFFGNPFIGYHRWQDSDSTPRWSWSVAVAGAAIWPLRRKVLNYSTPNPDDYVRAWDGGKSENLAALALIRRKMKNIIIVDAEMDPDHQFRAYTRLKQFLPNEGFAISIPLIDEFLATSPRVDTPFNPAVATGWVTFLTPGKAANDSIRVLYLKMGRPGTVEALFDSASTEYKRGKVLRNRIEQRLALGTGAPWDKCAALAGHPDGFRRETAIYNTATYARFLDERLQARMGHHLPTLFRYDFPHISTGDQSLYRDQTRALIGLGYLMALRVKEAAAGVKETLPPAEATIDPPPPRTPAVFLEKAYFSALSPTGKKLLFEGQPTVHYYFWNRLSDSVWQQNGGPKWVLPVSVLFQVRMSIAHSMPVRTPSYRIRPIYVQRFLLRRNRTPTFNLYALSAGLAHYSNGQSGCTYLGFEQTDGGDCLVSDSALAAQRQTNVTDGDFSTTYITVGANWRRGRLVNPSKGVLRDQIRQQVTLSAEGQIHPIGMKPGGINREQAQQWGQHQWSVSADYEHRVVPGSKWGIRSLGFGSGYVRFQALYEQRFGGHAPSRIDRVQLEAAYVGERMEGFGGFLRWHSGYDYYNIQFQNRDRFLAFGLTWDPSRLDRLATAITQSASP